ncbi:MAG: peptidoglycan-binding protein [Deltaproteobacteria bacterium]|nr:peptidoglycan-binding protein [Deltaproteobacteria bacterium]
MIKAKLRLGDGLGNGRVWLGSVVRNAQMGLQHAGRQIVPDGEFGRNTLEELRAFQQSKGLAPSGEFDKQAWSQLAPDLAATVETTQQKIRESLPQFDGDLYWVHEREGHKGHPYWPEGESGVTLDPGVDLGHVSFEQISALYGGFLSAPQLATLKQAIGKKGDSARVALETIPGIKAIRISRAQALEVMPRAAKPYWNGIVKRFGATAATPAPPSVQTVMLSLAYNRGVGNADLQPLGAALSAGDWDGVADVVGAMQQNHSLQGIRSRRQHEAALIRAELDFLRS